MRRAADRIIRRRNPGAYRRLKKRLNPPYVSFQDRQSRLKTRCPLLSKLVRLSNGIAEGLSSGRGNVVTQLLDVLYSRARFRVSWKNLEYMG